jgi:topoisomerase-4 subunit A
MEQMSTGEIAITSLNKYKLQLLTKNKEVNEVLLSDIKLQNRAGRGSSIMIVQLDDEIKNVSLI